MSNSVKVTMEDHICKKCYILSRDKHVKPEKEKKKIMHYAMDISNGQGSSLLYNNSEMKSGSRFRIQFRMSADNSSPAYRMCCREKKNVSEG